MAPPDVLRSQIAALGISNDSHAEAGVEPNDTVVTYCHIGQQATATLFGALTLGHKVLLYDGSFEDWVRRDLPVENPAKRQH